MARLSIWNAKARAYDVYETPVANDIHAGAPPRHEGASELGATPDQAAWRLPTGARKIGMSEMPLGRIASLGDDTSSSSTKGALMLPLVYAGAAYLAWRIFR